MGPSVVALIRRTHERTAQAGGPARIDCRDMAQLLGLRASEAPGRNNPIGRTMRRASAFRLATADLDTGALAIHDTVAVLNLRQFRRLPYWAQERHLVVTDEAVGRLRAAGVDPSVLAGATQLRNRPLPAQLEAAHGLGGRRLVEPSEGGTPELATPDQVATAHLNRLAAPDRTGLKPPSVSL